MKLLIVEDEAKLADYLRANWSGGRGCVVEVASNGVDGLHMAASEGSHDPHRARHHASGIDGLGLLAARARAGRRQ